MKLYALLLVMLLTACGTSKVEQIKERVIVRESADSALCSGLKDPVDDLAGALLKRQKETPDEIIIKGTTLIKGYDSVC